jgi:hypothetical protein
MKERTLTNYPNHRYTLTSTGASSAKYGNCEVCGKPVSEVFQQTEEKRYENGWTRQGCHYLFGHKECLETKRVKLSDSMEEKV